MFFLLCTVHATMIKRKKAYEGAKYNVWRHKQLFMKTFSLKSEILLKCFWLDLTINFI